MPRVWLTCALGTAVVVALAIVLKNRPDAQAGVKGPQPPSPLSEQEVRLYIEIMPQVTQILRDAAVEYQRARVLNKGKVDDEAFGAKPQAQVDALLEKHHLTREDWSRIQKRVEYAVSVIRAVPQLERDRPEIEEQIRKKRVLLPQLSQPDQREAIEKEVRDLEALLAGEGPPLLEEDRELIHRYWRSLDAAAPQVGPPAKPKPPPEEPEKPAGK